MYAIVEITGKQYRVEKDITLNVDKFSHDKEEILLDKVLLFSNGEKILIGKPYLPNVKIKAKILGTVKGEKVRGIKFKRRKNYQRTMGHRQLYSQIKISDLIAK